MPQIIAILSMLHEPAGVNSATRRFRDQPVLAATLKRLGRASRLSQATILCWDDQASAAGECGATLWNAGPRQRAAPIESVAASRRWSDGWRGGLLNACEFDRGFYAPWIYDICRRGDADGVMLIDPACGMVDPVLVDDLLHHAQANPEVEICFSQAPGGLSGVLIRAVLLEKLAQTKTHAGVMLGYRPDSPRSDPIADPACAPIPIPLARTTRRFSLDSRRQCAMLSAATADLNGQLFKAGAMDLLAAVERNKSDPPFPREIVLELNTRRATEAIFRPGKRLSIQRPDLDLQTALRIFDELSEMDDIRLILAGVGDPLLHEQLPQIIQAAHASGIHAISVESDFAIDPAGHIAGLAESVTDMVCVHLPATSATSYQAMMGADCFDAVMANMQSFIDQRQAHGRGVPLLVPIFVKCRQNQSEMEAWYDHWLRLLGGAVISGPSDFGGLIADVAAADMSGPRRRPCVSLSRRLMVLSDGAIVTCEQDVLGRQPLGRHVKEAWQNAQAMHREHQAEQWGRHPACAGCKEWHRA